MKQINKRAESDNLTIFVLTVLVFVGLFYAANWFLGGSLTEIVGDMYHEIIGVLKNPLGSDESTSRFTTSTTSVNSENLPVECSEPFKCKKPLNQTTCPEIELAAYNKLCGIK